MFDIRHFENPSVFLGSSSPLLSALSTPLFPAGASWQLFFWIEHLSNERHWDVLFFFTSGMSKGTSWPLFFSMSASIRRVLSLGTTFSSCIFVHTTSAFFQSFVSSDTRNKAVGIRKGAFLYNLLWKTWHKVSSAHIWCSSPLSLHWSHFWQSAPCWERAIKALIWSSDWPSTML